MLVEVQTTDGPKKVRVCDYCRAACIPSGRFCSGRCARQYAEWQRPKKDVQTMTTKQAHDVWSILVAHAGAPDGERPRSDFVQAQSHSEHPQEYRFQGLLGFGGKFWRYDGRWYVTCYPEDETPARKEMIKKTNEALAALKEGAKVVK